MDGFRLFNIGIGELMFIMIMAGVFLGPGRIRIVARWLGENIAKLRNVSAGFLAQLNNELDDSDREDLRGALDDIRELQRQVTDLRRELISVPQKAYQDTKQDLKKAASIGIGNGSGNANGNNISSDNSIGAPPPPSLPNIVEVEDDLE